MKSTWRASILPSSSSVHLNNPFLRLPRLPLTPPLLSPPQRVVPNPTPLPSDADAALDHYELLSYAGVTDADVAEAARLLGAEHLSRVHATADGDAPAWPAEGVLFRCASGLELPVAAVTISRELPSLADASDPAGVKANPAERVVLTRTCVAFLDPSSPATYLTAEAFGAFGLERSVVTGPQRGFSCAGGVPIRPRAAHGLAADVCVLGADFLRFAQVEISYRDGAVRVHPRDLTGASAAARRRPQPPVVPAGAEAAVAVLQGHV